MDIYKAASLSTNSGSRPIKGGMPNELAGIDAVQKELESTRGALTQVIDRHEEFIANEHRASDASIIIGLEGLAVMLNTATFELGVHRGQHATACEGNVGSSQ